VHVVLPIWLVPASFPGGKAPGREADHSPPSMTEVKNVWICTSIAPYVFMAWYLIKHRDKFTLLLFPNIWTLPHFRRIQDCVLHIGGYTWTCI